MAWRDDPAYGVDPLGGAVPVAKPVNKRLGVATAVLAKMGLDDPDREVIEGWVSAESDDDGVYFAVHRNELRRICGDNGVLPGAVKRGPDVDVLAREVFAGEFRGGRYSS